MNVANHNIRKFDFAGKRVLLFDDTGDLPLIPQQVDILILSKSPKLYINELFESINTRQIVIDSSVPRWKARLWKKDAAALGIPCHDVSEQGAYVLEI
jgi:competence protein ComEC